MFGTDFVSDLFGTVLDVVYEDATLEIWGRSPVRDDSTGSFPLVKLSEAGVKIQFDYMTEEMKLEAGYSSNEVLIRMLQHGIEIPPDADSRIVTARGVHLVRPPITEDTFRIYWELRCRLNRV